MLTVLYPKILHFRLKKKSYLYIFALLFFKKSLHFVHTHLGIIENLVILGSSVVEQPAVKHLFHMKDTRKYADRAEYLKKAVAKRRKILKQKAIEYKGSVCQICGYNRCIEALEFHHYRNEKNFGISHRGFTRSWQKIEEELKLCVLLCANCHREVETGVTQLPRESGVETRWDNGEG